jgi:hypothetical protein
MPEGAQERLRALPIEEQMQLFCVSYCSSHIALERCSDFKGVIVDDGIIVGVLLSDFACQPTPCFIGEAVCTWDSEDNNGAGYKTRTEYTRLIYLEQEP